jgi:Tol biopolymer transport system component
VLYEMTAGSHAFGGTTPLEAAGAIATEQPIPFPQKPGLYGDLERLILTMLSNAPTARPTAASVAASLEQIASRAGRREERRRVLVFTTLAIRAGVLVLVWTQWMRNPPALSMRLDTKPLTGEAGQESNPALSPDGLSVIYSWRDSPSATPITYVREIGSERRTVLPVSSPYNWFPDGRRITFLRKIDGQHALFTISKDGTGEQELLRENEIVHFEWSPQGNWLLYSGKPANSVHHAIFLFDTSTRKSRQITFPPVASIGDEYFAISPDGRQLVFRRMINYGNSDLFLTPVPGPGDAKQITFQRVAGETLAWSRDGSAILSSAGSSNSLWLHPLRSPEKPTRLTELGMEAVGIRSAHGRNRIAWVNRLEDTNIWRVPVTGGKAQRVVSSVMRDVDIASSSLGTLAFRSDRSGSPEVWIATKDGESQKMVTNLRTFTGSPRWSPDGRRIAFGSRPGNGELDVFVMECDPQMQCGSPVRLTDHAATDTNPNWSADGSSVYFGSLRSGEWQVWKTAANGSGKATQVTARGGFFATESTDGSWLYYSRNHSPEVMGVWRKALTKRDSDLRTDDPGEMVFSLQYLATATWILSRDKIFYTTPGSGFFTPEPGQPPMALWEFDLQKQRSRLVHQIDDVPLARGLSLSSDQKWLYFVRLDR